MFNELLVNGMLLSVYMSFMDCNFFVSGFVRRKKLFYKSKSRASLSQLDSE